MFGGRGIPNQTRKTVKKSKFTEAQIAFVLKQADTGTQVEEVCRTFGISQATFFNWKKRYGGMGTNELRHLRQLEGENRCLKHLLADLSLDKRMLQDMLKKTVKPAVHKQMADWMINQYESSVRCAYSVVMLSTSMYYYRPVDRHK